MKLLITFMSMFSVLTFAHEGHDHTPRWKRLPSSVEGVLKEKIREGKYTGLSHEFDPRQKSVVSQFASKKVFKEKDYIIKKSHSCDLEVSHSAEALSFGIRAKPVHYYEKSPIEKWKRAPEALVYQKDDYEVTLSIPVENLAQKKGYPKNIGAEMILSELPGEEPFTLKKRKSKVISEGREYVFLMGDLAFTLGVSKSGEIKFFNLQESRKAPGEVRPFDRFTTCFITR